MKVKETSVHTKELILTPKDVELAIRHYAVWLNESINPNATITLEIGHQPGGEVIPSITVIAKYNGGDEREVNSDDVEGVQGES